jgi:hypothetical protein
VCQTHFICASRVSRQELRFLWRLPFICISNDMRWPPLTIKTGSLFLLFVAAVLFLVYLMVAALFHARPTERLHIDRPPANSSQ